LISRQAGLRRPAVARRSQQSLLLRFSV